MSAATSSMSTPPQRIRTARAVVNMAAGGVGADAGLRLAEIGAAWGLEMPVAEVGPQDLRAALDAALGVGPDLLVVLAGDGTAALAAELCGADGPLLAPLPGGTMNMLPHALYGARPWPEAFEAALRDARIAELSGGEVSGRPFHVAAMLGEPALWAEAREAMRRRRPRLALLRARRAWMRTLSGRLRFTLDDGEPRKAAALTLMCPLVSRALAFDGALEAAALDPHDAVEGFRLGLATLMGRWRDDPAVTTRFCGTGRAWAKGRIPVILDGEPFRLASPIVFRYRPRAFRALVPADYQPLRKPAPAIAGATA